MIDMIIPAIKMRRARRALSKKMIPDEILKRIMTAATYAPSCFNNQSWRFLVITEPEALEKIRSALSEGNYWARKAPVVVVVVTRADFGCRLSDGRDYAFFDCGLAVENLMLQACEDGLYAHPIAGYDPLEVKNAFDIPADFTVITLVPIGYPGTPDDLNDKHKAAEQSERQRKPQVEVMCFNEWTLS